LDLQDSLWAFGSASQYAHSSIKASTARRHFSAEVPKHEVALSAFYLDKRGVMDAEFKRFIDVNPQWHSDRIPPNVIAVTT
jgi:formylglycine-generating enzyme required for sulfatase activity